MWKITQHQNIPSFKKKNTTVTRMFNWVNVSQIN